MPLRIDLTGRCNIPLGIYPTGRFTIPLKTDTTGIYTMPLRIYVTGRCTMPLTGADPGGARGAPPPSKIGKNMIFWRKIVIFHTKYPNNFRACLRSAQFF